MISNQWSEIDDWAWMLRMMKTGYVRMLHSMIEKADSFCGPLGGTLHEDPSDYTASSD
jgi:hypothetical protein